MPSRKSLGLAMALLVGCGAPLPASVLRTVTPIAAVAGDSEEPEEDDTDPTGPEGSSKAPSPAVVPSAAPIPTPTLPKVAIPPPSTRAPSKPDPLVASVLARGGAALKDVLAAPKKYRFQVIYAPVTTPTQGPATLERHEYRADAEYFFPASSMKVPIALAGYERLPTMRAAGIPSLSRDASLRIFPLEGEAEPYVTTLARETWRALIVSDNFSANRLLAFTGHREANETLWGLRLGSARVHTGFSMTADSAPPEVSPRIGVVSPSGTIEDIPARRSGLALPKTKAAGLDIGTAAIVDGRRVPGPMSFADKNAISLRDLQDTLVRIVRPDLVAKGSPTGHVAKEDLAYLKKALGTLPSQSGIAGYDRNVVADYRLVPFLRGIERVLSRDKFEIYTKVGQAYGFLTANAYIVQKETGKGFFLLATIYANPNEVLNDDTYAYETIAFPVLADVAEAFTRHAFAK
jgi:hypothetical protein